jgi:hypothetical protein
MASSSLSAPSKLSSSKALPVLLGGVEETWAEMVKLQLRRVSEHPETTRTP